MVESANIIWADGPSADPHEPPKHKIRQWGTWLESLVTSGVLSSGPWFATKESMTLGYAANTIAVVYADTTASEDGLYIKVGASGSGSWSQLTTFLPGYQFVTASPTEASTGNSIVATTSPRLPAGDGVALVSLAIPQTNTASPVTVTFDGGSPLTIKTNSGNNVSAGGLVPGMILFGFISGSTFRMIGDQLSSAIVADAEARLREMIRRYVGTFSSSAAADSYLSSMGLPKPTGATFFNSATTTWFYWSGTSWEAFPYATVIDGGVTEAKMAARLRPSIRLESRADGTSYNLAGIQSVVVNRYSATSEYAPATYERVPQPGNLQPTHTARFQDANGIWYENVEPVQTPQMYGATTGNPAVSSGAIIQALYNRAWTDPRVKVVKHVGDYYSSIALSPALAQSGGGNFVMPFELEWVHSSITFTGTGHSAAVAYYIKNNNSQKNVMNGVIRGVMRLYNEGDWQDGVVFTGMNWWQTEKIEIGAFDYGLNLPVKNFTRRNITYSSNNGKGGVWNQWGTVVSRGGFLPFLVNTDCNANHWDRVFSSYGTDGQVFIGGERNHFSMISCEVQTESPRYMIQTSGDEIVIDNFELEGQGALSTQNADYQAAFWVSGGTVSATGSFFGLSTKALSLKQSGSAGRLRRFNGDAVPKAVIDEVWGATT